MTSRHHFLLVTYPVHSHINPTLQLVKHLLSLGVKVTLATSASTCRRLMASTAQHEELNFVEFPDNFIKAFGDDAGEEENLLKLEIRRSCSDALAQVILTSAEQGRPITCSVYTPTVPWVSGVVDQLPVPSVLFWTQPATVLVIYYYFFFGYGDAMTHLFKESSSTCSIDLPGLPFSLKARDLPTFMRPVNPHPHPWGIKLFELQTKWIAREENRNVLVNTFDSLEPEALKAVKELNMIPIGPLFPSYFADSDEKTEDYVQWLDAKTDASVIYISFGSIWVLSRDQTEELARALLEVGRPFIWIIRTPTEEEQKKNGDDFTQLGCFKELEQLGLIVPWCSQVKVLSHPSVGCFLTHCGWNSTLESLAAGVPMVGIPLCVEQTTNAKLLEEYWKCGVRACVNEDDLVEKDEIMRCLKLVMEDEGMRGNAIKWKELALKAAAENGPPDGNLSRFIKGLRLG